MDYYTATNWTDRETDLAAPLSTEEQAATEQAQLDAIRRWIEMEGN